MKDETLTRRIILGGKEYTIEELSFRQAKKILSFAKTHDIDIENLDIKGVIDKLINDGLVGDFASIVVGEKIDEDKIKMSELIGAADAFLALNRRWLTVSTTFLRNLTVAFLQTAKKEAGTTSQKD